MIALGFIGTDNSHCAALARWCHDPAAPGHVPGARVVAAWKGGSPDMELSRSRVEAFAAELAGSHGVEFCSTPGDVARRCDAVLITSVDGRAHLDQVRAVLPAGKPIFIDKPLAASFRDAAQIAAEAERAGVPWFSASSLRFDPAVRALCASGAIGTRSAVATGPAIAASPISDVWFYGVHTVEALVAAMGSGCSAVAVTRDSDGDVLTGTWPGGRTGVARLLRTGATEFTLRVAGPEGRRETRAGAAYPELGREILAFARSGRPPVPADETLEIVAFLDAAEQSRQSGGRPIQLSQRSTWRATNPSSTSQG